MSPLRLLLFVFNLWKFGSCITSLSGKISCSGDLQISPTPSKTVNLCDDKTDKSLGANAYGFSVTWRLDKTFTVHTIYLRLKDKSDYDDIQSVQATVNFPKSNDYFSIMKWSKDCLIQTNRLESGEFEIFIDRCCEKCCQEAKWAVGNQISVSINKKSRAPLNVVELNARGLEATESGNLLMYRPLTKSLEQSSSCSNWGPYANDEYENRAFELTSSNPWTADIGRNAELGMLKIKFAGNFGDTKIVLRDESSPQANVKYCHLRKSYYPGRMELCCDLIGQKARLILIDAGKTDKVDLYEIQLYSADTFQYAQSAVSCRGSEKFELSSY